MREPFTQLYLHLVWTTWDRAPLVTPSVEKRLYGTILDKCRELKCLPIRIGGIEDHVHLLVRLHTTIAVATLVKEVKGSSSHLMTHEITPGEFFKWQGAYGAFTLRRDDVPVVKDYILNQKEHHGSGTVREEWEKSEIREEAELGWGEFDYQVAG
ncbi:MAG TPA: IS200/IS605 family transposase [Anaerolineae bacterium]|nr:IS200/IS605 family transposase [Anaerolineae bacterium]